jgi:hypothetical protein
VNAPRPTSVVVRRFRDSLALSFLGTDLPTVYIPPTMLQQFAAAVLAVAVDVNETEYVRSSLAPVEVAPEVRS